MHRIMKFLFYVFNVVMMIWLIATWIGIAGVADFSEKGHLAGFIVACLLAVVWCGWVWVPSLIIFGLLMKFTRK